MTGPGFPQIGLSEEIGPNPITLCPAVTPDGRFLFFIGDGDVWWMAADFIERVRPG